MQHNETRCELVMERSLNEHWGVLPDGELDLCGFRGDGGCSEFSNYLCITHFFDSESWEEMCRHVCEVIGTEDPRVIQQTLAEQDDAEGVA